ncbi:exosortase C-terminal domain/associated protein EpsI [Desulfosarcina sp.]|uniref:exosortase C-terminal domain/associated protein EpsI n=1 Tax=Desulfosarcina sp. TaxID=2027861 RepID=UPI0035668C0C
MNWKNTLAATSIMILTFGLLTYFSHPEIIAVNKPFSTFPSQIGQWKGVEERFDEKIYQVLGVDDSFFAYYRAPHEPWVNLYIGFYASQREGELIHSPKNCMPGGGWNIIEIAIEPLRLNDGAVTDHQIIKLVLQNGSSKQISLYWYQSRGRIISSEYMQKIYLVWDAITRNRTDGSFVRLIAPVVVNEEQTLATLKNFARDLFPIIQEYIPS